MTASFVKRFEILTSNSGENVFGKPVFLDPTNLKLERWNTTFKSFGT